MISSSTDSDINVKENQGSNPGHPQGFRPEVRRIDYMRISVTDRCNLRCSYCMPKDGVSPQPHENILAFEEIVRVARCFASLGGRKLRLTGGDPLVRKGIVDLVKRLKSISGIEEICLTTNGVLLPLYAEGLKKAGVKRINISLDTLREDRFSLITRSNGLSQVLDGIRMVKELGFQSTKINMVVMKGINDDEIFDFVRFAMKKGLILRFIEFMKSTPLWEERFFKPIEEIVDECQQEFGLQRIIHKGLGPAQYYQSGDGRVGFIKTSHENCGNCSRLRLTSTGDVKVCLYQPDGVPLRELLRGGGTDEQIRNTIKNLMALKGDVKYSQWEKSDAYMCSVGG